ncbi:TipAS antibiotic-recognition domain-containing protein [Rickettsiales endosymbiont of Stachyamoeba lipophora]|uniref:TipAS antibiotic-recognition domain-containing protein n=1 Tax=Rickettsiales endosymbiont of Stachyamoeba lipophora TaxID=2486578 RepID=UPI000F654029|nr:TipAS antibiotic-recognition domain-containing protein [Rickettsiales endosymbiont of Stachyamoeba lipophora]AZL16344.1 hypothetical protein EF513_07385 [Rickettsiales endosymbiont of Stachyamoeba lipophora]
MIYSPNSEQQKLYEKYLINSEKVTPELLQESANKVKEWTKQEWQNSYQEFENLNLESKKAILEGLAVDSDQVQQLVRKHYIQVSKFWTPDRESYKGLGQLYTEHKDFVKLYNAVHPNLAQFLQQAIETFAEREL